ncbi:MAG: M36 family metallopeptidase [Candidatus Muiribacteriota bacterium]
MKKSFIVFVLFLFVLSLYSFVPGEGDNFLLNTQRTDVYSENAYLNINNIVQNDIDIIWNQNQAVPTTFFAEVERENNVFEKFSRSLPESVKLIKRKSDSERVIYETYSGIYRVFPGRVNNVITNEREIYVTGTFVFNDNVINTRAIDLNSAFENALDYLRTDDYKVISEEKVLFNTLNGLKHAYNFKIHSKNPLGDFLITVDANNGDILYCDNFLVYEGETGRAAVYVTNPLKSDITEEKIKNIQKPGQLYGYFSNIVNDDYDNAYSEGNNFVYDGTDPNFDDSMVYYHMDYIHSFFTENMGYSGLDKSMRSIVYHGDKYDNAFFSPWGQYFGFGEGDSLNILSREAAVIYHEYTHAVSYQIAYLGSSGEAGAMNEAFSDYFGNSITDDPDIGEWVVDKMDRPYLRSSINDVMYPDDMIDQQHHDSQVYSACLWMMREQFGTEVTDEMVHFSKFKITNQSSFFDGVSALLKVDRDRFNGQYSDQILEIFASRGITLNGSEFSDRMREKINFQKIYK